MLSRDITLHHLQRGSLLCESDWRSIVVDSLIAITTLIHSVSAWWWSFRWRWWSEPCWCLMIWREKEKQGRFVRFTRFTFRWLEKKKKHLAEDDSLERGSRVASEKSCKLGGDQKRWILTICEICLVPFHILIIGGTILMEIQFWTICEIFLAQTPNLVISGADWEEIRPDGEFSANRRPSSMNPSFTLADPLVSCTVGCD